MALEVGDRIICIKSMCGNEGKIAEITSASQVDEMTINGQKWIDCLGCFIIESLGSPIARKNKNTSDIKFDKISVVKIDAINNGWRKLPKVEEPDLELEEAA